MEDVLEVYHRSYGENEVPVCLDEASKQLVQETRQPRPSRPGAAMLFSVNYSCRFTSTAIDRVVHHSDILEFDVQATAPARLDNARTWW